jgi:hypothetical protein
VADEQITARPKDGLGQAGEFTQKPTAGELKRSRDALEESEVPNIALDISQPSVKYRPIQLALTFFVLIMSLSTCGLGVHVENRFIFGFLLVCFGIAGVALCISIGFSLARVLKAKPELPRREPGEDPWAD